MTCIVLKAHEYLYQISQITDVWGGKKDDKHYMQNSQNVGAA